jgi:hypothetical protein
MLHRTQVGLDPDEPDMALCQCFYRWGALCLCLVHRVAGCRRAHHSRVPVTRFRARQRQAVGAPLGDSQIAPQNAASVMERALTPYYPVHAGYLPIMEIVFLAQKSYAEKDKMLCFESLWGMPAQGELRCTHWKQDCSLASSGIRMRASSGPPVLPDGRFG